MQVLINEMFLTQEKFEMLKEKVPNLTQLDAHDMMRVSISNFVINIC